MTGTQRDDAYGGDVVVGGPPAVRTLRDVVVRKLAVGSMANNAYLLTCRATGAQLLIDPAAEPDALLRLVRAGSGGGDLDRIVVTHRHPDHLGAVEDLVAVTGAPIAAGAPDADAIAAAVRLPVATRLHDGDALDVGHVRIGVVALRGHTPGSVALYLRDGGRVHLFTGDSLFPGGVGKTAGPTDFTQLLDDVTERLFGRFDDDTWVYPGHGPDTTLGAERPHLEGWRTRGW